MAESKKQGSEGEDELDFDSTIEGTVIDTTDKKDEDKPKVEVVVADDTPYEDKRVLDGRTRIKKTKAEDAEGELPPLPEGQDELDKEISEYGKRSQTRIRQLYDRFNDERRAKEAALRAEQEAVKYAERVNDEVRKLRDTLTKGEAHLIEQVKKKAEMGVAAAKKAYAEAYQSGDAEAIAKATEEMSAAVAERREAEAFKPGTTLQAEKKPVEVGEVKSAESDRRTAAPPPDPRAVRWAERNKWFGTDKKMTAYAYGLHQTLVLDEGVDPRSEQYYEKIDTEMRKRFPETFEKQPPAESERARTAPSKTVVAGVSRSPSSKKVTLTATQAALAKRLGVPLELYAEQVLKESGNA